jgi:hypothetical protein
LFSWDDIKETRKKISGKELKGLAIINDSDKEIRHEYIGALESKGADIILWNERHKPDMLIKIAA